MEQELGHKVDAKLTLGQMADKGRSFVDTYPDVAEWIAKAMVTDFKPEDVVTKKWVLPAGAYGGPRGGPI